MASRGWWALVAVGSVALFLGVGFLPPEALTALGVAVPLAIASFGIVAWRRLGHGWVPALSWAVPLGIWFLAMNFLVHSSILATVGYYLGLAFLVAMIQSERTVDWWYRRILRRQHRQGGDARLELDARTTSESRSTSPLRREISTHLSDSSSSRDRLTLTRGVARPDQ